ncbi:MAG: hypothetical protein N838_25530 [Thiohalocapsa sp. PB-PSB1]|jgi:hypothetical protein|nr:MAG: hypothetical protein N838_25530 [Thiohalocapsa sp. PB-PSB1]
MYEDSAKLEYRSYTGTALPGTRDRVVTRRPRLEQAEHIAAAESRLAAGETQREVATALGVACSTLLE